MYFNYLFDFIINFSANIITAIITTFVINSLYEKNSRFKFLLIDFYKLLFDISDKRVKEIDKDKTIYLFNMLDCYLDKKKYRYIELSSSFNNVWRDISYTLRDDEQIVISRANPDLNELLRTLELYIGGK